MSMKRFAQLNEEDFKNIIDGNLESKSTKLATKNAVNIFRDYLTEKGLGVDFETFPKTELNSCLRTFYAELRNKDGKMYKRSSIQTIRSGLRRFLSQSHGIDIVGDPGFNAANEMYTCMCKDAYKHGRGRIEHKRPIEKSDLEKLYESLAFDINTPNGLLNKVWFELCMYFGCRGRENQRDLTIDMFGIATDDDGKRYVYQTQSEISKNNQGESTSEIIDAKFKNVRMYETQSRMCPVQSFDKYLSRRNPICEALFQAPRDSFLETDPVWFETRPLGKNRLGNKMKEIAEEAELSYPYTNHCIRSTPVTDLNYSEFEARSKNNMSTSPFVKFLTNTM